MTGDASTPHSYSIEQWLPVEPEEAFSFFADEKKLDDLTPPWFRIRVLGKSTPALKERTFLDYQMFLHGFPMKWRSRIEDWDPPHGFAYTQVKGPYRHWKHAHYFEAKKDGTLMTDRTFYLLHGEKWAGSLLKNWVENQIELIFQYRKERIERLFSSDNIRK